MSASPSFELAPAAVARVASVPLDALDALSAPELARQALDTDDADDPESADIFAAAYARTLQEHRARLWQRSAEDPRVRCGIALASPALLAKLRDTQPAPRRNKRARHLDTSLYRYLARAAGRLEPCGLWTSVALAHLSEDPNQDADDVRPCPSACHVAPDLGPFRALLQALGKREPYRSRGPYRLDPSLQRQASGRWQHARRGGEGGLRWTTLPASGVWALLARCWGDGQPRTHAQLLQALDPELSADNRVALLELADEAGLLLGGLDLPPRFASPWEALERVGPTLEPAHANAWTQTRASLEVICGEVEDALDAAANAAGPTRALAEIVLRGQQRLREQIEQLAATLELPTPPLRAALLRCDETAPFEIRLGAQARALLQDMLARWSTLERRNHSHGRWARSAARVLAESAGAPLASPRSSSVSTPASAGACEGPPLGALVLRPGREGLRTPYMRGLSHAPTVTHARHAYHLARRGDPLLPWLQASYRELERRHGVRALDLVHPTTASPNLLARPRYVEHTLAPWSCSGHGPRVEQLRLVPGPTPGALLLANDDMRWSAHVFTALTIHPSDAPSRRLLHTSFDLREAEVDPAEASRAAPTSAPDPDFPRPRRTRLSGPELEQLLTLRGAARYVHWQRLVRAHAWPRWVRVQCDARPALLLPTDGPLALEAVLEGVRITPAAADGSAPARVPEVVVEPLLDDAWLEGPRGRHLVEFVLPVRRTHHAWTRPCTAPTTTASTIPSTIPSEEPRHVHA